MENQSGHANILSKTSENHPFLGRKVLVYQRIIEDFSPNPPFPGIILADFKSRWLLKYKDMTGNWVQKRLLKGACSTKPIDKTVDKSVLQPKTEKPKVQLRRRLPSKRS